MFLKAIVFPGLASILCCLAFAFAFAPAAAQGAEGSAIERLLRGGGSGGGGGGGGGYYGGGSYYSTSDRATSQAVAIVMWASFGCFVVWKLGTCLRDGETGNCQAQARACRAAGHSILRTDCMTLASGPDGHDYRESWICDLCDQKFYDRLAPIARCLQCKLDFCQTCLARTSASMQPIEIATLRGAEARGSPNPSSLVTGAQPLLEQALAHPSQSAREPVFMAVPVDGPPEQLGTAVAVVSRPIAPPQPAQEQEHATPKCVQSYDEPEPEDFQFSGPRWKPEADCDGLAAKERALWLIKNKGMEAEEAKHVVMKQFPKPFL